MLGLPPEGWFRLELEERPEGWGTVEELLAGIIETIDTGNRYVYGAFSKKGSPLPKPVEVRRPRKKRRPATSEDLVAMFGGVARYTGAQRSPVDERRVAPDVEHASRPPAKATRRTTPAKRDGSRRSRSTGDGSGTASADD